jgi:nucleotide-binding universal stress UspA family protein
MYSRILTPLDGSTLAEEALLWARHLAGELNIPLGLLRVVPGGVAVPSKQLYLQKVYAEMHQEAREYLARMEPSLKEQGLTVSWKVVEGVPADCIIREGKTTPGTLLTIATNGRSGIQRLVWGSTAEQVVRHGGLPTLVIPAGSEARKLLPREVQGILVPLDGSPRSEDALPHALALARSLQVPITLLQAVHPPENWLGELRSYTQVLPQLVAEAEQYLAQQQEQLRATAATGISHEVVSGSPAETIVQYAEQPRKNLVVMATRGRSGLGRWVLGSVTDRVLHLGRLPVLLAPPRQVNTQA